MAPNENVLRSLRDLIHELKDPFAALHGGIQLSGHDAFGAEEKEQLRRSMDRNAQVMKVLLEDAGVYLGLLSEPPEPLLEQKDLRSLLEAAVERVNAQTAVREQRVTLNSIPATTVSTEVRSVERAAGCLLGVLSRVSRQEASLSLGAEILDGRLVIEVRGDSSGAHWKDFDFRLALARCLATRLGGQIVEREQGLELSFPCEALEPGTHQVASLNPAKVPKPGLGKRVLVVEDNSVALKVTLGMLERLEVEAWGAVDARQGLELVARHKPQLILCDLGLPGEMDGYGFARAIRAQTSSIALVAVTGEAGAGPRAREAGFDDVVEKPLGDSVLRKLLEEHLGMALRPK